MYVVLLISAHFDLASTKSSHLPNWRVPKRFGEYEIEVTRHFGEYDFFLMSNPEYIIFEKSQQLELSANKT